MHGPEAFYSLAIASMLAALLVMLSLVNGMENYGSPAEIHDSAYPPMQNNAIAGVDASR